MNNTGSIDILNTPREIWARIFMTVSDNDLKTQIRISRVCKFFFTINEEVRRGKIERRWQHLQSVFKLKNESEILSCILSYSSLQKELDLYVFFNKSTFNVNEINLPGISPILVNLVKDLSLIKIVKFLLNNKNAIPDLREPFLNRTAFFNAASCNNLSACRQLIGKGVNVNEEVEKTTPLHLAAQACARLGGSGLYDYLCSLPNINQEIVDKCDKKARDYLLPFKLPSRVLEKIFCFIEPSDYLTQARLVQVNRIFKKYFQEKIKERFVRLEIDLLYEFVALDREHLFLYLLEHKSASKHQKMNLIALLQTMDPNFAYDLQNHNTTRDSRPLIAVARFPHLLVIARLLLAKGASPSIADPGEFWTPLHVASYKHNWGMCKLLIEHGANVNAQSSADGTPLHLASKRGDLKICQLLIEHGANFLAKDKGGLTPLHYARQGALKSGDSTVFRYLLSVLILGAYCSRQLSNEVKDEN